MVPKPDVTARLTSAWAASADALLLGTERGGVFVRQPDGGYVTLAEGGDARATKDLWWSAGATDGWAVGNGGLALRWNGREWRKATVPTNADLLSVWGSAPDSVWIVSDGEILRWDGTSWTSAASTARLTTVWGTSSTDVWAFGSLGFLHWNGAQWSSSPVPFQRVPAPTVVAAWGASSSDLWAVGTAGAIAHWNGASWTEVSQTLTTATLIAVSGTGPSLVEAITSTGVLHFDGSTWSAAPSPATAPLTGLWFDPQGVRWLSTQFDLYRKDGAGETRGPSAPAPITKLKGGSGGLRVLAGGSILRHGP
ncbi:MAG: hypothetical protein Q8L48_21495 [Archangium sp.]|nr:hypothetical protein [Archangium sp.]